MKAYFLAGAAAAGIVTMAVFTFYSKTPGGTGPRKITLVYASNVAFHETMQEALLKAIKSSEHNDLNVEIIAIPRIEDTASVNALCQRALLTPTGCIISVGKLITITLANLARKRLAKTPRVFVGIQNPVDLGLVDSVEKPGGFTTGVVIATLKGSMPARALYAAFPRIKSVLIPFHFSLDPTGEIASWTEECKDYLETHGIRTTILLLDSLPDALNKIAATIPGHDTLLTLESEATNDLLFAGIAKLARQYDIGYFAGTMAALDEGAMGVYASSVEYIAQAAVAQAIKIIYFGKNPAALPVACLDATRELIVNQRRAEELGLKILFEKVIARMSTDPLLGVAKSRVRLTH